MEGFEPSCVHYPFSCLEDRGDTPARWASPFSGDRDKPEDHAALRIGSGALGGTRTHTVTFRKRMLCPVELRAQNLESRAGIKPAFSGLQPDTSSFCHRDKILVLLAGIEPTTNRYERPALPLS